MSKLLCRFILLHSSLILSASAQRTANFQTNTSPRNQPASRIPMSLLPNARQRRPRRSVTLQPSRNTASITTGGTRSVASAGFHQEALMKAQIHVSRVDPKHGKRVDRGRS
jgi:hypothetical protein